MLKITTWWPDTCGCRINYSWDDEAPEDQRVLTYCDPKANPVVYTKVKEPIFLRREDGSPVLKGVWNPKVQKVEQTGIIVGYNEREVAIPINEIRCEHHIAADNLYQVCLDENQLKNRVVNTLEGKGNKVVFCTFDSDRRLYIKVNPGAGMTMDLLSITALLDSNDLKRTTLKVISDPNQILDADEVGKLFPK